MSTESLVLSIPELARMLGISRGTCYSLARQGKLPVPLIVLGRRVVVSRRVVEALLEAGMPEVGND